MAMQYDLTFEYAAILISAIIIFYMDTNKVARVNAQSRLFLLLVCFNGITAIVDVINNYSMLYGLPVIVSYTCSMIYFFTHLAITPLLFYYFLSMSKNWNSISSRLKFIFMIPYLVVMILLVINPVSRFIFHYDDKLYVRGDGYFILYAMACLYMLGIIYVALAYRKQFTLVRRLAALGYVLFNIIGVAGQFLYMEMRLETFTIAFGNMVMFFLITNPRDQIDKETGLLNKSAFTDSMNQYFLNKKYVDLIEVIITDYDDVEKRVGYYGKGAAAKSIGAFLAEITDGSRVFRVDTDIYCIEIKDTDDEMVESIMSAILSRFSKPWQHHGAKIIYKVKLCHIVIPEKVDSMGCLLSVISDSKAGGDKSIINVDDYDLTKYERESRLHNAVLSCIEERNFEQMYSPIYSVSSGTVVAAAIETFFMAKDFGVVSEREVKIDKESAGHVLEIAKVLFEKACKFYDESHLGNKGIRFIGIPVNSVVCVEYDFFDKIDLLVKDYHINPRKICFMVSEAMISACPDAIEKHMHRLKKEGFRFCLSEYGSGFTNISSLYEYKFDFINISELVFKSACNNDKAKVTLESTIALAKSLDMKTIISGIENENELKVAEGLSCDYTEGPFFRRNISETGLLKVLNSRLETSAAIKSGEGMWERI